MILKSDPEARNVFFSILFRSTYYVLTAYFTALLLERLIIFTGALIYGYGINFNYEYLKPKGDQSEWSQESVLSLYLFPYFIYAALIVWLHLKTRKFESKPGFKQIFLYWLILFFTYRLIGILPAHLYSCTGIWHAFRWLYLGKGAVTLIGLLSVVLYFPVSVWLLTRIFLIYSRINNNLDTIGLPLLAFASFSVPAALGCTAAVLFFLPGLPKEEILGLIFIALPVIFVFFRLILSERNFSASVIWLEEIFYQWQILVFVLVIIIIIRILLGIGIIIPSRL
jgi:hypothetical protein